MAEPHVITALVRRRAELSGDIEITHERLSQMIKDLETLDKTILMFDPDYQVETIKPKAFRPPEDWSKRGEMSRLVLSIIRQSSEPLTTRDIAILLMTERALDTYNTKLVRLMTRRVATCLRDKRRMGAVRSIQGPGQYNLWEAAH